MNQADEERIAAVKKALAPYLKPKLEPETIKEKKPYQPQKSADPPYPPTRAPTLVTPRGESVGRAWDVVTERLPEEWHINRLALDKGAMWHASAAPVTPWAWSMATKQGLSRKRKYIEGEGISAVEALLDLAVQLENWPDGYEADASRGQRRDAVDQLFDHLFDG